MKIKAGYKMVVVVNTECDGLNFRIHNSLNDMFIASEGSIMMIEKPKGRCYGFFSIDSYELSENFASLLLNLCSCSTCCSRGFAFQFSQVDGPPMLLSQKNLGMQPKRTLKKAPKKPRFKLGARYIPIRLLAKGQSTSLCCTRSLICCTRNN